MTDSCSFESDLSNESVELVRTTGLNDLNHLVGLNRINYITKMTLINKANKMPTFRAYWDRVMTFNRF